MYAIFPYCVSCNWRKTSSLDFAQFFLILFCEFVWLALDYTWHYSWSKRDQNKIKSWDEKSTVSRTCTHYPHSITHTGACHTVPPIGRVYFIFLHTWFFFFLKLKTIQQRLRVITQCDIYRGALKQLMLQPCCTMIRAADQLSCVKQDSISNYSFRIPHND